MGVWGTGNFDGDEPREFLAQMVAGWELIIDTSLTGAMPEEVDGIVQEAGLETCEACVMPAIEVMVTVAERLDPSHLPDAKIVDRWRNQYLSLFDREAHVLYGGDGDQDDDEAGPSDAGARFIAERRRVIEATFGRLLDIVHSRPGAATEG